MSIRKIDSVKYMAGHLIGCGKNLKIMRKFSAILCGRKWRLCGKDARLCGNFYNLITLLPWLFPTYKTHVNVLPIILVLYDPFDLLLPFVDTYFFVQRNFSMVFEGFRCCVCPKLSNQALIRDEKKLDTTRTRTQAHHKKTHRTPGGLKLFTNEKTCFRRCFGWITSSKWPISSIFLLLMMVISWFLAYM